jgi:hypothetical protein
VDFSGVAVERGVVTGRMRITLLVPLFCGCRELRLTEPYHQLNGQSY